jgi:rare lipoprotein A
MLNKKIFLLGGICLVMSGCAMHQSSRDSKDLLANPTASVMIRVAEPKVQPKKIAAPKEKYQVGQASWYGEKWHGRRTASGVAFNQNSYTAAHPTLPLMSAARITNLDNNKEIIVLINDRGPYKNERILDVSRKAAKSLDMLVRGLAMVKIEPVALSALLDMKELQHIPKWKRNQMIVRRIEQINAQNSMHG